MPNFCKELHTWAHTLPVHSFPYDERAIPLNGIYMLFERGEVGHDVSRIVRVGTHTGQDQLRSRLRQHFLTPNKDRSIFRKNIGRCILNKSADPYLPVWELDMTSKIARDTHTELLDVKHQQDIEKEISAYMQKNFSFAVIEVSDKQARLDLESKIISTVSACDICRPSSRWLGLHSTKEKIRTSGLWLVNELYKEPLGALDMKKLAATFILKSRTQH